MSHISIRAFSEMLTQVVSLMAVASTARIDNTTVRLDMCRTLLDDEKCNRTMPITHGHYPVTKPDDRLILRISSDRNRHSKFPTVLYPYNCHILKDGEITTEENAFVLGGCPNKKNVAIYQTKTPIRVKFTMLDVLDDLRTQMSGNYIVKCVVAECSRKSSYKKCPAYDHCEGGIQWNPGVEEVNVYQTPAAIKIRFYPMYQSAHRH
ncbi:hypothetical protein GCK32_000621 [Trichostrongylus colubriformis]|uniref:ZP domain-containing protein n=1 Tax=Trichostrongylus colubriformis TaxID=6319 RepID=A0AAN8J2B9_TRICO